ncbi:MAG TPA: hypothetical protein GYA07_03550 [Verrucomicrobia bacterium]|nr:hypothetical protein [Verrucomicrobiota bacterium]
MPAALSMMLSARASTFGEDVAFLKQHTEVIVLTDRTGESKVAVAPAWQGRVMTSSAKGDDGLSFGWINRDLIASGKTVPHMNPFGGEDRFWMGPEGGQFSIFFAKDAPFTFEHWFTPAALDTDPFKTTSVTRERAIFEAQFTLTNYSGTIFDVAVRREIRVLDTGGAWRRLGMGAVQGVDLVAFESDNRITNVGKNRWNRETGLLSIWILGMFNPSPSTTVVVPIRKGPESQLGMKVTSDYFGSILADRLTVRDDVIYFAADGNYRSKIGISPRRSKGILGSYDADHKVLTIVQFTQPRGRTDYVNSLWKLQDDPYSGDAANSYNDGPPMPGAKPMGPFYELESSSPAAALAPGRSASHVHRTFHISGPESALDRIARSTLGVSLEDIRSGLKK